VYVIVSPRIGSLPGYNGYNPIQATRFPLQPLPTLCVSLSLSILSPRLSMDYAYALLDGGYIPDAALRPVIRQLCRKRQREIEHGALCPLVHNSSTWQRAILLAGDITTSAA
jgi:hypothetical protein